MSADLITFLGPIYRGFPWEQWYRWISKETTPARGPTCHNER
jgi:hypothetical protein